MQSPKEFQEVFDAVLRQMRAEGYQANVAAEIFHYAMREWRIEEILAENLYAEDLEKAVRATPPEDEPEEDPFSRPDPFAEEEARNLANHLPGCLHPGCRRVVELDEAFCFEHANDLRTG